MASRSFRKDQSSKKSPVSSSHHNSPTSRSQHQLPTTNYHQTISSANTNSNNNNAAGLTLLALNHHNNVISNQFAEDFDTNNPNNRHLKRKLQSQQDSLLTSLPDFYSSNPQKQQQQSTNPSVSFSLANNNNAASSNNLANAKSASPGNHRSSRNNSPSGWKRKSSNQHSAPRSGSPPKPSATSFATQKSNSKKSSYHLPSALLSQSSSSEFESIVQEERSSSANMRKRSTSLKQRTTTPKSTTASTARRDHHLHYDPSSTSDAEQYWTRLSRHDPVTEEKVILMRTEIQKKECPFSPKLSTRTRSGDHARLVDYNTMMKLRIQKEKLLQESAVAAAEASVAQQQNESGMLHQQQHQSTSARQKHSIEVSDPNLIDKQRPKKTPVKSIYHNLFRGAPKKSGIDNKNNSSTKLAAETQEDPDLAGVGPPPEEDDDDDDNKESAGRNLSTSNLVDFSNNNNNNSPRTSTGNKKFQLDLTRSLKREPPSVFYRKYQQQLQRQLQEDEQYQMQVAQHKRGGNSRRRGDSFFDGASLSPETNQKTAELAYISSQVNYQQEQEEYRRNQIQHPIYSFQPQVTGKAARLCADRDTVAENFNWQKSRKEKLYKLQEQRDKEETKKFVDTHTFEPQVDFHSEHLVYSMGDRRMTVQDQALMTSRQRADEAITEMAMRHLEKEKDLKFLDQQRRKEQEMLREEEKQRKRVDFSASSGDPVVDENTKANGQRRNSATVNQEGGTQTTSKKLQKSLQIHDLRRQWMQAVFAQP